MLGEFLESDSFLGLHACIRPFFLFFFYTVRLNILSEILCTLIHCYDHAFVDHVKHGDCTLVCEITALEKRLILLLLLFLWI